MGITPGSVHNIKKGSSIMIDGAPCRVISITISRPGKHGHAKARIEAMGLIDNRKRIIIRPGDARIDIPTVDKKSAQVLSVSGDKAQIMDSATYETFDIDIPEGLKGKVAAGVNVSYWDVVGAKILKEVRK